MSKAQAPHYHTTQAPGPGPTAPAWGLFCAQLRPWGCACWVRAVSMCSAAASRACDGPDSLSRSWGWPQVCRQELGPF